jgi:hypothetical protein
MIAGAGKRIRVTHEVNIAVAKAERFFPLIDRGVPL